MKIYGFDSKCNICGENIRQIRAKKKVTQTDLAARLQVRGVQINQNAPTFVREARFSTLGAAQAWINKRFNIEAADEEPAE